MNAPIFLVLNANVPGLPGDWFLAPRPTEQVGVPPSWVKGTWTNDAAKGQRFPSYQAALDEAHRQGLKSSNVFGPVEESMMGGES